MKTFNTEKKKKENKIKEKREQYRVKLLHLNDDDRLWGGGGWVESGWGDIFDEIERKQK